MSRIKIRSSDTKTTKTIANSKLIEKVMMIVISSIPSSIEMRKLSRKLPMTYSTIDKVIRTLEELELISIQYDGKFKVIIPSEKLLSLRQKIIALVREVENLERI